MRDTKLFTGAWYPVLGHARARHPFVHIECDGFLDSIDPDFSMDVAAYIDQGRLLRQFLNDKNFPWPFAL